METTDKIVSITKRYFYPQDFYDEPHGSSEEPLYGYIIETDKKIYGIGIYYKSDIGCLHAFFAKNRNDLKLLHKNITKNRGEGNGITQVSYEHLETYKGEMILNIKINDMDFNLNENGFISMDFLDLETTKGILIFSDHGKNHKHNGENTFVACVDKATVNPNLLYNVN